MIKAAIKELDVTEEANNTQATQKTKSKETVISTKAKKKKTVSEIKRTIKSHSHDLLAKKISKEIESKHQMLKEFKRQVFHNKYFIYLFIYFFGYTIDYFLLILFFLFYF